MGLRERYGEELDDRLDADYVELFIDQAGKCWVNIDGRCVARIGRVANVKIDVYGVVTKDAVIPNYSALPSNPVKG